MGPVSALLPLIPDMGAMVDTEDMVVMVDMADTERDLLMPSPLLLLMLMLMPDMDMEDMVDTADMVDTEVDMVDTEVDMVVMVDMADMERDLLMPSPPLLLRLMLMLMLT